MAEPVNSSRALRLSGGIEGGSVGHAPPMVTGATTSAEGFEAFVQAGALADMPGVRTRMPSASVISRVRGCAGCGPHQFVQVRFPLSPPSWAFEADRSEERRVGKECRSR